MGKLKLNDGTYFTSDSVFNVCRSIRRTTRRRYGGLPLRRSQGILSTPERIESVECFGAD